MLDNDLKPRKLGRPATGKDPHMTARFPARLVATVENWAEQNEMSRSEAIRRLVEMGLDFSIYVQSNCS